MLSGGLERLSVAQSEKFVLLQASFAIAGLKPNYGSVSVKV